MIRMVLGRRNTLRDAATLKFPSAILLLSFSGMSFTSNAAPVKQPTRAQANSFLEGPAWGALHGTLLSVSPNSKPNGNLKELVPYSVMPTKVPHLLECEGYPSGAYRLSQYAKYLTALDGFS